MLKRLERPILIGTVLLSLFVWSACGGSDDDDDGGNTTDPVSTLPAGAGDIIDDLPDSGSTDSEEGSASASITAEGETIEIDGGTCTVADTPSGGKALAVTIDPETGGGLSIGIGALASQTSADSGEDITDAVVSFRVGDVAYVATGQAGTVVVKVDSDLGGGEFSGMFNKPAQPRSEEVEATGTFSCK
jgi:hypothetical protein